MGRYFHSTNEFNVAANAISGNILPLSDEDMNLSLTSIVWVIIAWVIKIAYFLTTFTGSLYFANLTVIDALKRSGPTFAVWFEMMIPSIYLNLHRIDLRHLISKYNDILIDSDEMKSLVVDTIRPYKNGLQCYIISCLIAVCAWSVKPAFGILNNDRFTYANYSAPAYFPGEPFGPKTFLGGIVLQIVGSSMMTISKISIDIYISHFIAVLTAQYKYVRAQMARALALEHHQEDDLSVISALQNCIRHHCTVIEIGQRLSKLMALQIGTTYISCILKFCFLAFGVITFERANFEKVMYVLYASGSILHIFVYCTCIQELYDVSTSVTEDAFHENWYGRSRSVKQLFYTIEISNQMECRMSAYRIVDLVVPTMAVILSKSYSVCLLLLKVN